MLDQLPPEEKKKTPGNGFFLVLGIVTVIALAIVWAFNSH